MSGENEDSILFEDALPSDRTSTPQIIGLNTALLNTPDGSARRA
ncbi:MAG: hypothetical protein P8X90_13470 [Desulfobacterales bacterium]